MKKYLILFLFICSCASLNITESQHKYTFDQLMRKNFYDSDIALRKVDGVTKNVKLIKVKEVSDIISTIVMLSSELDNRFIVHYVEFSSPYRFTVDEEAIKKLAIEKNCDLVVYTELEDIEKYQLHNNFRTKKIIKRDGYHFFNAFFYSKVDKRHSISLPDKE